MPMPAPCEAGAGAGATACVSPVCNAGMGSIADGPDNGSRGGGGATERVGRPEAGACREGTSTGTSRGAVRFASPAGRLVDDGGAARLVVVGAVVVALVVEGAGLAVAVAVGVGVRVAVGAGLGPMRRGPTGTIPLSSTGPWTCPFPVGAELGAGVFGRLKSGVCCAPSGWTASNAAAIGITRGEAWRENVMANGNGSGKRIVPSEAALNRR